MECSPNKDPTTKLKVDGFRAGVTDSCIGVRFHQEPIEGTSGKDFQLWKCNGYRKPPAKCPQLPAAWVEDAQEDSGRSYQDTSFASSHLPDHRRSSGCSSLGFYLKTGADHGMTQMIDWRQTSKCLSYSVSSLSHHFLWTFSPLIPSQCRSTNLEPGPVPDPGSPPPKEYCLFHVTCACVPSRSVLSAQSIYTLPVLAPSHLLESGPHNPLI